jgi:hypothetical protein
VRTHFAKRYAGDAFGEWIRDLFDLPEARLCACRRMARAKKRTAARLYAGRAAAR